MGPVPRLVVVDSLHEIARIVRGAMALLDRQYVLVEVPDSAEALHEVQQMDVDLLVTAARLPGALDGFELAHQVHLDSLRTPVIVLAEQGDPLPARAALAQAPCQCFVRPVAEPFLRGLRIALDGLPVVSAADPPVPELDALAQVPAVDFKALRAIMLPLMRDVGAMGVILADRLGRVLVDEGATGYIDRERLAALLGPSFGRAGEVGALVGGRAWAMQYYDGDRIDVYGLSLGLHYFLCLLFEGSNRAAMGAVAVYGRRAAEQMIAQIGAAAYAEPQPPQRAQPAAEPTADANAVPAPARARPSNGGENTPPLLQALPAAAFDPESLFAQPVDERLADSLFDPDALAKMAASFEPDDESVVDLDAAHDLGLLGD